MAYHIQSSFSAGEIDPALHERTTFDKYQAGLKTGRNTVIGKTGRAISRPMTKFQRRTKGFANRSFVFEVTAGGVTANYGEKTDHALGSEIKVRLTSTGTLPAPLATGTDYYLVYRDKDKFAFATTLNNSIDETVINITDVGTGVHTLTTVDSDYSQDCILYSPPYSQYLLEIGHRYCRRFDTSDWSYVDSGHNFTYEDLPYLQFSANKDYVYFTRLGKIIKRLTLSSGVFVGDKILTTIFETTSPATPTLSSGTGTGYNVEYAFTTVENGEESLASSTIITDQLPINSGEVNTFTFTPSTDATEIRAYRRPQTGQAYGFIGSTQASGGSATFRDWGQVADYAHSPPTCDFLPLASSYLLASSDSDLPKFAEGRCSCIYQQRLIMTRELNEEIINTSRTGYNHNFLRDYPLSDDSAMTLKCGSKGYAKVLRLMDSDGLLAFTTVGIFKHSGGLSPINLSMNKIGNWVIDEKVEPLEVPGAILFVDKSTNTIRTLVYSNEAGGYPGEELSIFSNHLFMNKNVKSWTFQDGDIPLIWVVMDDGSLLSLTYQRENKMQAWMRHDSHGGLFESSATIKDLDAKAVTYFVVNRDGTRNIEFTSDRFVADLKDFVGMDSAVTFKENLAEDGAEITVVAQDLSAWSGLLDISSDVDIFTNTDDNGAVGSIFRFFDSEGSAVDLEVTTYTDTKHVTVQPSCEFPSNEGVNIDLYKTFNVLTNLTHLEGEIVSVMSDGYLVSSPLNNEENYPELTVQTGEVSLPEGKRGAIIHVGLPVACDIETLDIDTVEQKPTLLESRLVNRLYLKVHNTRGLFVGQTFPVNDRVDGMLDPETITEDIEFGLVGNAAQKPKTKRYEVPIPNDWSSNGRVCIRQVDPLPFEILSIIPDLSIIT